MAFLLRLGQYVNASRDQKEFWQQVAISLQAEHMDLPFALIYSVDGDFNDAISEASDQSHEGRKWSLECKLRVPSSCSSIPTRSTEQEMEDFLPGFSDLIRAGSSTLLLAENGTLPEVLAWNIPVMDNEPAQSAVFLPIRSTGDAVFGFMVLGLNPRKRFDGDYEVFIELLNRQLATSLAVSHIICTQGSLANSKQSAVLFEEEIRRAARDRTLLTKKLALQTHEAFETETRFRRMADLAPVGMFHIDPTGVLVYANENYYG